MLHCQNCKTPLIPGAMQCPGCGTPVSQSTPPPGNQSSYNPPSWAGQAPPRNNPPSMVGQTPPGGNNPPSWAGQAPPGNNPPSWAGLPPGNNPPSMAGQVPPGGYNPPSWAGQAPPGEDSLSLGEGQTRVENGAGSFRAPGSPWEASSPPNAFEQSWNAQPPQSPPYANAPAPFSPPASSFSSPPASPGMSKRMFITLIALAALVILSGIGLVFYTEVARPAQLSASATATMQSLAASTATANMYATGTAQVTATAHVKATTQAKATATAIQSVYANATAGSPAFSSSLGFQDDGNWDTYDAQGGGGCAFRDGALHSTIMKKSFYVPCFAKATSFNNFALETSVTIVKGDEGGLIFRGNDKTSKFYYFRIGRDGFYSLNVSKDDKNSTPLLYDTSPAIKKGAGNTNLLTVIARGKEIYLFINKQFVAGTTDASYSTGEIGVFAGNNGNETDVAFSNVSVWDL